MEVHKEKYNCIQTIKIREIQKKLVIKLYKANEITKTI